MFLVSVHSHLPGDSLAALFGLPTLICAALRIPLSAGVGEAMKTLASNLKLH